MTDFTSRLAQIDDLDALKALMNRSIAQLQGAFLTPEQILASYHVMGLDAQLVRDQTYFMIECDGQLAGCGGWSFRATLYGGDDSIVTREPQRLDPAIDAAKVRAMYTDPGFVRRGVGGLILSLCEKAAREAGFRSVELMATAAGVPLYAAKGYRPSAPLVHSVVAGVSVPLLRMSKAL
jgi:GNAT superfamily N-acetyltransferase